MMVIHLFWPEMFTSIIVMIFTIVVVLFIPEGTELVAIVMAQAIGEVLVTNSPPRPVVIGRLIPMIMSVYIIYIVYLIKILRAVNCNIKTEGRRHDKERGGGNNDLRHGYSNIYTNIYLSPSCRSQ